MPASGNLYRKAQEIKDTLYPKLRTVSMVDTLMPDDYNVPYQIMKALLEAVGETSPIPDRKIRLHDDVYPEHVSDLKKICYKLWNYMNVKLKEPYTTDPEFFLLKTLLDIMRMPKHGDELQAMEWNTIFDYCRRMINLILRYPAGFFESWDDWHHVFCNWAIGSLAEGYRCILDTSTYVSTPSSLTCDPNPPEFFGCILMNPDYINTPYVQIETYAKTKGDWGTKGGALGFSFRNISIQIGIGGPPPPWIPCEERFLWIPAPDLESFLEADWVYEIDCIEAPYMLFFDTFQNKCKAYWAENFSPVLIGEETLDVKPAHANVWNKYRASLSKREEGINLKLEYWDGNQWRTMASFDHDSDTFWKDENGVPYDYHHGISSSARYWSWKTLEYKDVRVWIDDTFVSKL